jgi:hypothetical protein
VEANAYLNPDYLQAYEAFGVPVNIGSGDNPRVATQLIPKEWLSFTTKRDADF